MTVYEIISYIQNIFNNGPKTDEAQLSDRLAYFLIRKFRAKRIKEKSDKFNKIPDTYYQSVDCFPMELTQMIDCDCIDTGCKVLKSTYKVPLFVTGRNSALLNVYTLTGESISPSSLEETKYNKYSKTKKNKRFWFMWNDYLVVVDPDNMLENVIIKGVFEDPLSLDGLGACDGVTCSDPYEEDFPLNGDDLDVVTALVMKELQTMISMPADLDNDSKQVELRPR